MMAALIGAALELGLPLAALLAAAKRVKYEAAGAAVLSRSDVLFIAVVSVSAAAGARFAHPAALWAAAAGATIVCALLLLDVIMYRVFTIELRPDGLSGVIFSELYWEVLGLSHARRVLRAHAALWFMPAVVALLHLRLLLPADSPARQVFAAV